MDRQAQWLVAIGVAAAVWGLGGPVAAVCLTPPGDVTGEGTTSVVDVQCGIVQVLAEIGAGVDSVPACVMGQPERVDANCDLLRDVSDVLIIVGYVLGMPLDSTLDTDGNSCPDLCDNPCLDPGACDDGADCTADVCDPVTGDCTHTPDNALCASPDACSTGVCKLPSNCCQELPGVGCNDPDCQAMVCAADPFCCETQWDSICATAGGEMCGGCVAGCATVTPDCDDGIACTLDSCDPVAGCVHPTDPAQCDDFIDCTIDQCDAATGLCSNTASDALCDDGVSCTTEACVPDVGCGIALNDSACDDGNPCTTDFCTGGGCSSATPVTCLDGVDCTVDACDPALGCTFTPDVALCDDGDPCTVASACDAVAGCSFEPGCDDGVDCTVDSCDPATGACSFTPNDSNCPNNGCNTSVCVASSNCCTIHGGVGCSDPVCQAAVCGADPFCCDTQWDELCVGAANASCNSCTGGCEASTSSCDDGIDCTIDACTDDGECISVADDAACDDGASCTTNICQPGAGCQSFENCSTSNPCVSPSCGVVPNSASSCSALGWPISAVDPTICGESDGASVGCADCCTVNSGPSCSNPSCVACVCQQDNFCCGVQWDQTCVNIANFDCNSSCIASAGCAGKSFATASAQCATVGARLCTIEELSLSSATASTGCSDNILAWSSTPCDQGKVWAGPPDSASLSFIALTCVATNIGSYNVRCCADVTPVSNDPGCNYTAVSGCSSAPEAPF